MCAVRSSKFYFQLLTGATKFIPLYSITALKRVVVVEGMIERVAASDY
jgi:hypothetical protein